MTVHLARRPPPGMAAATASEAPISGYVAVAVDAAVNLVQAREYEGLDRPKRLHTALAEQQLFLNGLLGYAGRAAFDLRYIVVPGAPVPVRCAVIARVWGTTEPAVTSAALSLRDHMAAILPRHVAGTAVTNPDDLAAVIEPFGDQALASATITKREVVGTPSRPDAGVAYYFSVIPFNWVEHDWLGVYSSLAAATVPLVVSTGLLPLAVPPAVGQMLATTATYYGRLAREDEQEGGLYFGRQKLPPDAFAVEAEQVFADCARRYAKSAFAIRLQVAAPGALPSGVVETVGAAVAPADNDPGSHLDRRRAGGAYEVRRRSAPVGAEMDRWNLNTVDFRPVPGDPGIWERPDPPPPAMSVLAVLGDSRDAGCAFHLPIAVDGVLPGFRVRRGQFGHAEAYTGDGPSIRLGHVIDSEQPVSMALGSLTKHALVAGSTGSGKTSTVLELLRQLWIDRRIPFLVIEPVNAEANDYRTLLGEPGFADAMEVLTVGDEAVAPLRFNPLEVPQGVLVSEHVANLLACFKAAFGLWEPLPGIYQDALDLTYLRAGFLASQRAGEGTARWPTVVELLAAMRSVTKDLGYAGEVKANIEAASVRRAQQLAAGTAASTFLTDQPFDVGSLLGHPVVLELKSLGSGDDQALMMALLLNAVTEHYQANRGASSGLMHVTVIEEAHRLLARPEPGKAAEDAQAKEKAAESFANTLAENRKYGEGIIIAEQIPTKLVADAVKNTNLKVMHRLTAEEDRRYLGESMGMDEAQVRFATRLRTGEALLYSDEFAEAVHVNVPRTAPVHPAPVAVRSRPPLQACGPCRSKCRYRGAALSIVRDPSVRDRLRNRTADLERPGLDRSATARGWEELIRCLRAEVRAFPSLVAADRPTPGGIAVPDTDWGLAGDDSSLATDAPAIDDAAWCLFLHSLATRTMRFNPAWPAALARRLILRNEPARG